MALVRRAFPRRAAPARRHTAPAAGHIRPPRHRHPAQGGDPLVAPQTPHREPSQPLAISSGGCSATTSLAQRFRFAQTSYRALRFATRPGFRFAYPLPPPSAQEHTCTAARPAAPQPAPGGQTTGPGHAAGPLQRPGFLAGNRTELRMARDAALRLLLAIARSAARDLLPGESFSSAAPSARALRRSRIYTRRPKFGEFSAKFHRIFIEISLIFH